jgi:predicted metalloprotease with PDZ domain
MSLILLLSSAALIAAGDTSAQTARPAPPLHIAISPLPRVNPESLAVELRFTARASGDTPLRLPSEWAGQTELYKAIHNLRMTGVGATIAATDTPFVMRVKSRPNAPLVVRYELVPDDTGVVTNPRYFHAMVHHDWLQLVGQYALVLPDLGDGPMATQIAWRDLPAGWTVATSFGRGITQQRNLTSDQLRDGLFVAGQWRMHRTLVHGRPVFTAMRGQWEFTDSAFGALVARVVAVERDFWRDNDAPYYLVTIIPSLHDRGGTRLENSFEIFLDSSYALDGRVTHLLAHEMFHEWNGGLLHGPDGPEQTLKWFSEGFTDYFAGALIHQRGVVSDSENVADINNRLRRYALSPVRDSSYALIMREYWNDNDVRQLPYDRGALLAWYLDRSIRTASRGTRTLGDVMRRLAAHRALVSLGVTRGAIAGALRPELGAGIDTTLDALLDARRPIPLDSAALGPCYHLVTDTVPRFAIGFNLGRSTRTRIVSGVDSGGAAFRAGLRNGQKLKGWSIYNGDPTHDAVLTVQEDSAARKIVFRPAGPLTAVPRYEEMSGCRAQPH